MRLLFVCLCAGLLSACSSLAVPEGRTLSRALPMQDSQTTSLGRAIAPLAQAHPGQSGIFPLADAHEAFAARVLLARAAERTLDVQFYIWRLDTTGLVRAFASAAALVAPASRSAARALRCAMASSE